MMLSIPAGMSAIIDSYFQRISEIRNDDERISALGVAVGAIARLSNFDHISRFDDVLIILYELINEIEQQKDCT